MDIKKFAFDMGAKAFEMEKQSAKVRLPKKAPAPKAPVTKAPPAVAPAAPVVPPAAPAAAPAAQPTWGDISKGVWGKMKGNPLGMALGGAGLMYLMNKKDQAPASPAAAGVGAGFGAVDSTNPMTDEFTKRMMNEGARSRALHNAVRFMNEMYYPGSTQ